MKTVELRQKFLDFFEDRGHCVVVSSPVIPHGDPTLLFTNAGMNQFKDVLLGQEVREYKRAVSVQKCIRAGGKHNDLDDVGKDSRHLTFFEMLGNWSFGDYYKKEAIVWAWEFVTEVLKLPKERLYVSIYKDDEEAFSIWNDIVGLPEERIARFGDLEKADEENFWSMGPTGPCGPCTEIFYDHHPDQGPFEWKPGFDEERIVEFWNLVFMEFDRSEDGTLASLPIKSVDTGMGLDRMACIMSGVDNIFYTDLFEPIILATAELLNLPDRDLDSIRKRDDFSAFSVIADHIRTLTFSLADGGKFSNEGRGYVLRRILRRAVRFGRNLGFSSPFLCQLTHVLARHFGDVYPEIRATVTEISDMIKREEERFFRTIDRGIERFNQLAATTAKSGNQIIEGQEAFKLYDTFGFPLDLTQIMAEEAGLKVDVDGFNDALKEQQERARSHDDRYTSHGEWKTVHEGVANSSVAWKSLQHRTNILRIRHHQDTDLWDILLSETPFYAESGGQVGDSGKIVDTANQFEFLILDTQNTPSGLTHIGRAVKGNPNTVDLSSPVDALVDAQRRSEITCNHTATHLLHAALHHHVSESAFQSGSFVGPDRLRFDFSFDRPLTDEEISQIETHVNANIRQEIPLAIHLDISREKAEEMGAMAIFGEKYGETVRVVEIPQVSVELCGGCHVQNTKDIAYFRISSETGVAAGVRRIEAITNRAAFEEANEQRTLIRDISLQLKADEVDLNTRVDKLLSENRRLQQRGEQLVKRLSVFDTIEIAGESTTIEGISVATARVEVSSREELLHYMDTLRDRMGEQSIALLGAILDNKPALICTVTDDVFKSMGLKAGDLINDVAPIVGGKGGGRPTLAQAGGSKPDRLNEALEAFTGSLKERLT